MKILVCDDRDDDGARTVERIEDLSLPNVESVHLRAREQLTDELGVLLPDPDLEGWTGSASLFDAYDLVLVDNNLSSLGVKGARMTAESIAGYIRAYSKAPYVVSLNKNLNVDFDLRYLIGDYSTVADIAVNSSHLSNMALWTGRPADARAGFKPWYWPTLLDEPERRKKQIAFVSTRLDEAIFGALGLSSKVASYISRHATATVSPDVPWATHNEAPSQSSSIEGVTFRRFFEARNRSLPQDDRTRLLEIAQSGSPASHAALEVISRVVAADLDLWIRRDLIAPQDALVDLPHLIARMPFLLGTRAEDVAAWNQSSEVTAFPFGVEIGLADQYL